MAIHAFRVSLRRARAVFGPILQQYRARRYPFNLPYVVVPQIEKNLPPGMMPGSKEEALLLFYFCSYMKGGIDSTTAIQGLSRLFSAQPEMFDPKYVIDNVTSETLAQLLKDYGLGFSSGVIAEHWIENSWRLHHRYDGDPRRMFVDVKNFGGACKHLLKRTSKKHGELGFLGFGHKMVSMLIYFYMEAGIIPKWHFPPPIDIHWLRIIVAHRIVEWRDGEAGQPKYNAGSPTPRNYYHPVVMAQLRRLLVRYTRTDQVDPIEFSDAIWLFARSMCFENPGNWFNQLGEYKARKTEIERQPLVWDDRQRQAFMRSCAQCPVHLSCERNVPSMPYYRHGRIVVMGRREEPPDADTIRHFALSSLFPPTP